MSDSERRVHVAVGRARCFTGFLAVVLISGVYALPSKSCTDPKYRALNNDVVSSLLQAKVLEGRGSEKVRERGEVVGDLMNFAKSDIDWIAPAEHRDELQGLGEKSGRNVGKEFIEFRDDLAYDAYIASKLEDTIPDACTVNFSKAKHQDHLNSSWHESPTIGGMFDGKLSNATRSARYDKCAVVGSGGSMYGRHLGAEIDAHDAVFRMNNHAVHGWEEDVGRQTNFRLFYPESSDLLRQGGEIPDMAVFVPYKKADRYWYSCLRAGRKGLCNCVREHGIKPDFWLSEVACRNDLEVGQMAMVSELFIQLQHEVYHRAGLGKNPSAGFTALTLALAICKDVDVYGLGSAPGRCKYNAPGGCKSLWQYSNCQKSQHDFSGEHGYYHALQEAGIINMRTDKLQNKS